MENKINKYDLIKLLITGAMGLALILSLFFNIYYISFLGYFEGESGFEFLTFDTNLSEILSDGVVTWWSIICLTQLIYGIFCILVCLYFGYELHNGNKKNQFENVLLFLNTGAVVILIFYCVAGIVSKSCICDNIQYVSKVYENSQINNLKSLVHTNTFIGLIIGGVVYVGFIIVSLQSEKVLRAEEEQLEDTDSTEFNDEIGIQTRLSQNPKINRSVSSNANATFDDKNIDLINKYFELFEKGAITQEEFEERKKIIFK